MDKRRITHYAIIAAIIIIVILTITLGLVFGLRKNDDDNEEKGTNNTNNNDNTNNGEDDVEIVNLYNNTEELSEKFPVINNVTILDGIEKNIQNRLLTGFENWNRGFKAWKKWGDILYTNESIYNVNGVHMTLAQYQASMDVTLKRYKIELGQFHNMVINGNYTAIFYDQFQGEQRTPGTVMEFVRFKDYGEELGTRVVVGWGGTKGNSFDSMRTYQGDQQRMIQDEQINLLLHYQIPTTGTLREKYPILFPVEYLDNDKANKYIDIILEWFDKWNTGIDDYITWIDQGYTNNATSYDLNRKQRNVKNYIGAIKELNETYDIKKLYFDNILIRDEWAALHYRYRRVNRADNTTYVGDRMQFLKFVEEDGNYKIEESHIK